MNKMNYEKLGTILVAIGLADLLAGLGVMLYQLVTLSYQAAMTTVGLSAVTAFIYAIPFVLASVFCQALGKHFWKNARSTAATNKMAA